jgi:hypothetical protein
MQLNGFPVSAKLHDDLGLGKRFWYWRGASGRSYIHSIYQADACPPLPGAVYVAVKNRGGYREALAVGRFASCWDGSLKGFEASRLLPQGADEIHVHLLARDSSAADAVLDDLVSAIDHDMEPARSAFGLQESSQAALSFA